MNSVEEFKNKWNTKFRPDLNLPMHIKRKIYKIYRKDLFLDLDVLIYNLIIKEFNFNNITPIKDTKIWETKGVRIYDIDI